MSAELAALRSGDPDAIAAAFGSYSTEADYWKLMKNGNIAYDGVATLRDENGNIIHSAASMGLKETQLEGSLLKILGIDPKNEAQVKAVQGLMVSAGIQHSTSSDPDQWAWGGERPVIVAWEGSKGTIPVTATVDLTERNQGKEISLDAIRSLYSSIRASKSTIGGFVDYTYGSAIGMLDYAGNSLASETILSRNP